MGAFPFGQGGPIQSFPIGQRFGGLGQGFDAFYDEKPFVGPRTEELFRTGSGPSVGGIGATEMPVGLLGVDPVVPTARSGMVEPMTTGNGPAASQSMMYNLNLGVSTRKPDTNYTIPPRVS